MKKIVLFCVFTVLTVGIYAQRNPQVAQGKIIGKIMSHGTNSPLEYATISLLDQNKKLLTGTITDSLGKFELPVSPGEYHLEMQFISYEKSSSEKIVISKSKPVYDIGTSYLKPQTTALNEVSVVAEKSEFVIGMDKKIFNVGKDLSNAGNSASDILDNIPSVNVDIDGNVSLRGSENLQILIDGKPSGLVGAGKTDALRSIQGSMIESIEVITNPSAKYEAEGMAGIINIVLKKDQKKGVNGSFEVHAGDPLEYGAGVNVNFRREKINYFVNYGSNYRERIGDGYAYQVFSLADTNYITEFTRDRFRTGWSHNLRGGADYFINENNVITGAVMIGFSDETNTTRLNYNDFTSSKELLNETMRVDVENEIERNIEFSLNYERKFSEKNRSFNAFFHYVEEGETEKSDISENIYPVNGELFADDLVLQKSINEESQRNYLFQADYSHPFGAEGKVEAGYRSELRYINNPYKVEEKDESGAWQSLENFTNDVDYSENIHAAYAQAGNTFGKFMIQLGLRAELSDVSVYLQETDELNDQLYIDYFPTAHTTYKFNEINSWQLSYSRRINRPHFWYLNPFYSYSDARNIRTGNPQLKPEYTNAFETGYLLNKTLFNFYFGGYYRTTKGVIERVSYLEEGINFVIPYNLSKSESYGLESNFTLDLVKWWTFNSDVSFYRSLTNGTFQEEKLYSDTYSWNARFNSKFKLPGDVDIQTIFFYRGKQKNTQGTRQPFYMMNTGISKDIFNGNGTITLNVRDVFNTRKFRFILDRPDLYSENEFRWSSRSIKISFVYRLNQMKKMERQNDNNIGDGGGMGF